MCHHTLLETAYTAHHWPTKPKHEDEIGHYLQPPVTLDSKNKASGYRSIQRRAIILESEGYTPKHLKRNRIGPTLKD